MKKSLLIYRHLYVLAYIIVILILFKVTTNFHFDNGLSFLFLGLLIIFPLGLYIWSYSQIRKARIKHHIKMQGYFEGIKKDVNNKYIYTHLISRIEKLGYSAYIEYENDIVHIYINNNNYTVLHITFDKHKAEVKIENTFIVYRFYYSYVTGEFTKYDLRNFEYKETKVLYESIYSLISKLINHKYIYVQKSHLVKLTRVDNNKDIYVRKTPIIVSTKLCKEKNTIDI